MTQTIGHPIRKGIPSTWEFLLAGAWHQPLFIYYRIVLRSVLKLSINIPEAELKVCNLTENTETELKVGAN